MNTTIAKQPFKSIKPSELSDWLTAHGIPAITTEECAHLLGIPANEVSQRLIRLRSKGQQVAAARGLWIPVPAEYREMGAPEPIRYIHYLMSFYGCNYGVGWLSSASLNGSSHQAPQVFQVAVDKPLRARSIGRSNLQFYYRSYIPMITKQKLSFSAGSAFVCTPGATMLMVSADPMYCSGIDNAATIICELSDDHEDYMKDVMANAAFFPRSAIHRLGWILDHLAGISDLDVLMEYCNRLSEPTMLSPGGARSGSIDKKWNVIENRRIEADI